VLEITTKAKLNFHHIVFTIHVIVREHTGPVFLFVYSISMFHSCMVPLRTITVSN